MELYAAIQPLVYSPDLYQLMYGEDDPEELAILAMQDREKAHKIEEVLKELFFLEANLSEPGSVDGDPVEIGDSEALDELRTIAAAVHGCTPDDYWEGNVPPGFQFNHLINHATEDGYYLPVDFPQAFFLEETSIGSAVVLLKELAALEPVLAARFPEGTEVPGPVRVWQALRDLCQESVRTGLPICLG